MAISRYYGNAQPTPGGATNGGQPGYPTQQDFESAAFRTYTTNRDAAVENAAGNRWNEVGPTGSVEWTLRPGADPNNIRPGDYIRRTSLAPGQQQLLDNSTNLSNNFAPYLTQAMNSLQPDEAARQRLTDSLYRRNTQFYDRRFGVDQNALETKLLNSGLARGSEAWNNEMATFNENKQKAYGDASDRAVTGAEAQLQENQNGAMNRLLAGLAGMRAGMPAMPQSSNTGQLPFTGGTDYTGALNNFTNAEATRRGENVATNNASSARDSQVVTSAAMVAAAYL